jgi:hypothetical protein
MDSRRTGVRFPAMVHICLVATASIPALGPHPASQPTGIRDFLSSYKRPDREPDHCSPASVEMKNAWAVPSLPHMSS